MNVFNKVAFESLRKSKSRTFVTIVGVALSAALITAGATFGVSLLNYMVDGAAAKSGNWHVGFEEVSSSFVKERKKDPEAAMVTVTENLGFAKPQGSKKLETSETPYLFLTAYKEDTFDTLPVQLISGRLPKNSSETLVSGGAVSAGGMNLTEGDLLTLSVGDRMKNGEKLAQSDPYEDGKEIFRERYQKAYTVVGICQRPSYTESDAPGYALITLSGEDGEADSYSVFTALKNPRRAKDYAKDKGEAQAVLNNDVLRFMGVSGSDIFNLLLYAVGGIATAIIMVGSVFLIRNAFHISLNERTRQFGILMSVGATKKQLKNSVLFEGMCIGIAGIPAGVLLGIAGTKLVIYIVSENFEGILYSNVPLKMVLSAPAILAAVLISLVTILISAYLPARKAVKTPVMECIRQTNEVKMSGKDVKTGTFSERLFGLPGMLALKNFRRNKRRYRSIILSLVLSVTLFIATNSFVLELKQASEAAVVFTTFNVAFSAPDMPDEELLRFRDEVKAEEEVTECFYQADINCHTIVRTEELTDELKVVMGIPEGEREVKLQAMLQIVDDNVYEELAKEAGLDTEKSSGEDITLLAAAKVFEETNRLREADEFPDMFCDSEKEMDLMTPMQGTSGNGAEESADMRVKLHIAEMVMPDGIPTLKSDDTLADVPYVFAVMAPYSMKDKLITPDTHIAVKGLSVNSDRAARTENDIRTLISESGMNYSYLLVNMDSMAEQNNNMIFIANVFCYTFIAMISLIAVANVFNTISTNIKLRRRELAMLRSVGMSERSFQRMMNFECMLYGLRALLWGIPLSLLASYGIYHVMQFGADNIDFVIPWVSIGISMAGVFIIVFVTMMYSVSKIKKENIIDALRDDMT